MRDCQFDSGFQSNKEVEELIGRSELTSRVGGAPDIRRAKRTCKGSQTYNAVLSFHYATLMLPRYRLDGDVLFRSLTGQYRNISAPLLIPSRELLISSPQF
jgi:hypothetical protein